MPACNFMARHAAAVASGQKRMTIRKGKRFKVGDRFFGYFAMRTNRCTLLTRGRVTAADAIVVHTRHVIYLGREMSATGADWRMEALARSDGFRSSVEFFKFFAETHDLPLIGQCIMWEPDYVGELGIRKRLAALGVLLKDEGGER